MRLFVAAYTGGENIPTFPAHAQPVKLRIWQEAHWAQKRDLRAITQVV